MYVLDHLEWLVFENKSLSDRSIAEVLRVSASIFFVAEIIGLSNQRQEDHTLERSLFLSYDPSWDVASTQSDLHVFFYTVVASAYRVHKYYVTAKECFSELPFRTEAEVLGRCHERQATRLDYCNG